ncbi:MAG: DUF4290 domain-containing protein [Owenweeksia sp.]|nr:DUF4290 domain-containing protein [Owenweeksia sp.]
MQYNTSHPRLIIPEYGRNVQKMVDYLLTIEEREERNKQAQNLIEIIGNLNPQVRDVPDFKHKLWDHLFIMSDFRLDVDSPYPKPTKESFFEKPAPLHYPSNIRKYRHYGNVIRNMVQFAVEQEPGEYKERLKVAIANHMKKTYLIWNKDTVDDQVILNEMNDLANGELQLENMNLKDKQDLVRASHSHKGGKGGHKGRKGRKGGRKRYKKN